MRFKVNDIVKKQTSGRILIEQKCVFKGWFYYSFYKSSKGIADILEVKNKNKQGGIDG